jgi:hypothetical protein
VVSGWPSTQPQPLTWTVSPHVDGNGSGVPTDVHARVESALPWVRMDAAFTGAWSGRFALAAPASRLSANLWCAAMSPLVGILPEEAVDKALPPTRDATSIPWQSFTETLDNVVHTATRPPKVVRDLVVRFAWPRSDLLKKHER